MPIEVLTLYKLMVLYMLSKVNFPLTNAQISDFILGKEYTSYFTLQQVLSELLNAALISTKTIRHTTYYQMTSQGEETLGFFGNKISDLIKEEIDAYLMENKYELRNEVGTIADYYQSTNKDYIVHCQIKEGASTLIELNISVPTEEHAERMCFNWRSGSQDIYSYIMTVLSNKA